MERVGKVVALKASEAACRMMGPGKGNAPEDETAVTLPRPRPQPSHAPRGTVLCTTGYVSTTHVIGPASSAGPMPTTLPSSVQETLGDPAADDFARWLDENFDQRTVHPKEYHEVLTRLDVIDERFERVDERFDHVEERIDETNERLDRMEERFEKRFDQIDQRLDEQSAQFNQRIDEQSAQFNERIDRLHEQMRVQARWTVGTIALFGTIVTVLLAIAEFGA